MAIDTLSQATSSIITDGGILHDFINGDINLDVPTSEGNGTVPSLRKLIAGALAYKSPEAWSEGDTETDLLQPKIFSNAVYVPLTTPALMGAVPDNTLWRLFSASMVTTDIDSGVATEGQTTITISGATYIPGANNLQLFINGSIQTITDDYTETGNTTIEMVNALEAGDKWLVFINGRSVGADVVLSTNTTYTKLDGSTTNLEAFLHDVEAGIDVTSGLRTWSGTTTGTAYLPIAGCNTDQASAYIVHVGAVYQSPVTAYSVNTTLERIELSGTAPASGIAWTVVGVGYGVGVGNEAVLDSFNAALNTDLSGVDYCRTLAYYSGGYRGGAKFFKTGSTGTASTADLANGHFYDLSGNQFYMIDDGTINIDHFGAKNSTEDSSFDNSVICRLMLDCYGYCRRPAGTYRYITTYKIKTDEWDHGPADSFSGHIGLVDDAIVQEFVGNDGNKSTPHTRISLKGFKYRLNTSGLTGCTNYHVDARYGYMNEFEDLTFGDHSNGYAKGIILDDGNLHTLTKVRALRSRGGGFKEAIRMVRTSGSAGQTGSIQFNGCQFERDYAGNIGSTVYLENVRGASISDDNHFEVSGIYLYGCAACNVTPRWFSSSNLVEDIRSFDNEINVAGKSSNIAALGWSKIGGSARSMHDLVPFYDMRVGSKIGERISTNYNSAYGAAKSYSYGNTGDDVFFAIHIRSKTDITPTNLQIRIKDSTDAVVVSSPTFQLDPTTGTDVTGADLWRNGYTWLQTERVILDYLWVDVVDATTGATRSDVQCIVFASKAVNRNARFLESGGSSSGWTSASATATTPLVTTTNTTNTYSSGQLVCTPGSTGSWSTSQQLLLDPGKTYLIMVVGNCTSGDEPGIKVETYHNATVANNYINGEYTYNNNSDTESWSNGKFVISTTVRQIDNDSATFVSIGNLSGHSGAAVYFDWIAVFDVTPYSESKEIYETEKVFTASDTTPSVGGTTYWVTANAVATTITQFDGMVNGQEKWVRINDAYTTLDFTGTIMKGNNGGDYACGSGDMINVKMIAGNQYCTIIQA